MRLALVLLAAALGCTTEDDPCAAPTIELSAEAVVFGDVAPRHADDPGDVNDSQQAPTRRTVLVRNTCGPALHLTEACLIQNEHNGEGVPAFFLEGPDRAALGPGASAGLRVTYDALTPNDDRDQDAERDPDRAVLVIQSDAGNAPTVVVPVCARAVPADEPGNAPYDCPPPFTIAPGEALPDLCGR